MTIFGTHQAHSHRHRPDTAIPQMRPQAAEEHGDSAPTMVSAIRRSTPAVLAPGYPVPNLETMNPNPPPQRSRRAQYFIGAVAVRSSIGTLRPLLWLARSAGMPR